VKKRVLFVDDDQRMLDALRRTLARQNEDWALTFIRHPEIAWEALFKTAYDVVVLDIRMPGINGLELLDRMQRTEKTKDVPVVVLTGLNDRDLKRQALERGAMDLLNKPVDTGQLVARLRSLLRIKSYEDELRATNRLLSEKVRRQNLDLIHSRLSVFCRLGMAAEFRDEETGNHVIRVGCFSRAIAAALHMPRAFLEMILLAAPLHDVGKIGVPDSVLLKPGPLNDEEWAIMQQHCEIGERILRERSKVIIPLLDWYAAEPSSLDEYLAVCDPVMDAAASIALTHHEKWDGSGYPQGLSGESIPLESRIVAVADVFDALTSRRPYRAARPEEEALSIMSATVGSHFDPKVYQAFLNCLPEIRQLRERFADDVHLSPVLEGVLV